MSRIQTIIDKARVQLADPATGDERYSDARLLQAVSEAQQIIVVETNNVRTSVDIPLVQNQAVYTLPSDCLRPLTAEYQQKSIPLASASKKDKQSSSWRQDTGIELKEIVFDRRQHQKIRLYPIPQVDTTETISGSPYGVITSISGAYITEVNGVYGLASTVTADSVNLKITYVQYPEDVTTTSDTLKVPQECDNAIVHFTVASALLDNRDSESKALAGTKLEFFTSFVQKLKHESSLDFVLDDSAYSLAYTTGFGYGN